MRSALVAGGLLAFALSFDEIIVTTFTVGAGFKTLPLWFADNFSRPNAIPTVNVVATFVVIVVDHPGVLRPTVDRRSARHRRDGRLTLAARTPTCRGPRLPLGRSLAARCRRQLLLGVALVGRAATGTGQALLERGHEVEHLARVFGRGLGDDLLPGRLPVDEGEQLLAVARRGTWSARSRLSSDATSWRAISSSRSVGSLPLLERRTTSAAGTTSSS